MARIVAFAIVPFALAMNLSSVILSGLMSVRSGKRNPVSDIFCCLRTWRQLRRYPGLFSLPDAFQNWKEIVVPRRVSDQAAGRALAREAEIEKLDAGVSKVMVKGRNLVFYWAGPVENSLHYTIAQEFNPTYAHYYTTPPITLKPQSRVFDVGACEGLFAFRVLRQSLAAEVICFEPSAKNLKYTQKAAAENGVADRLRLEPLAVGKSSGRVRFEEEAATPDGHRIAATQGNSEEAVVDCVALDDYCVANDISLNSGDLIKIDAEGSDLDVLLGAERLIRTGAPQIAVTTYHRPEHAANMVDFLRSVQPAYKFRLKGFSFWTAVPTPVLLQAVVPGN